MKQTALTTTLLLFTLLCVISSAASASTWYVNGVSGSDGNDCKSSTTACKTVGHAISLAASGDSIRVAAATYTENLTISISLKILGSGAKTTILDGGGIGRVVTISSPAQVTLSGVTITNGYLTLGGGAGIGNGGVLTLRRSAVSGNRVKFPVGCDANCHTAGGGIFNGGILTIGNSTVSGNHVSLSTCEFNCSALGGGIYNLGTLLLYNSTISGNTASPLGAGHGSGIYTASPGTAIIQNSTLAGNLGGATIWGTAALQNSIVAHCGAGITSKGYNLSSDATCNFTSPGDLNNTDPKLGTLGYHGGPTQTIPLLSGSPAIDAGNPNGCTDGLGHLLKTDQRGAPRPDTEDTGGCDMGAYERQSD